MTLDLNNILMFNLNNNMQNNFHIIQSQIIKQVAGDIAFYD